VVDAREVRKLESKGEVESIASNPSCTFAQATRATKLTRILVTQINRKTATLLLSRAAISCGAVVDERARENRRRERRRCVEWERQDARTRPTAREQNPS
jgi:hypothetical protein